MSSKTYSNPSGKNNILSQTSFLNLIYDEGVFLSRIQRFAWPTECFTNSDPTLKVISMYQYGSRLAGVL